MPAQFFRFLLVGGMNTLFGFAVYAVLALTDLSTLAVLLTANVATITFNFLTTGGLVFRDMGADRVPRFIACYLVIVAMYWVLIHYLEPMAGGRIAAMAIIVLPMAALAYYLQSRFVFTRDKRAESELH